MRSWILSGGSDGRIARKGRGMRRVAIAGLWVLVAAMQVAVAAERDAIAPLDELLAQARGFTAAGKPEDAYALLARAEDDYIGEPRFDYALGRAALEAAQP